MIRPGEIYVADFAAFGPHRVIVVSREELNRGDKVVAVLCTSARFELRSRLPNCVAFFAGTFGFKINCVAQCEYVVTLEIEQLDMSSGPIGLLDDEALRDVGRAIGYVIECDCEPF